MLNLLHENINLILPIFVFGGMLCYFLYLLKDGSKVLIVHNDEYAVLNGMEAQELIGDCYSKLRHKGKIILLEGDDAIPIDESRPDCPLTNDERETIARARKYHSGPILIALDEELFGKASSIF